MEKWGNGEKGKRRMGKEMGDSMFPFSLSPFSLFSLFLLLPHTLCRIDYTLIFNFLKKEKAGKVVRFRTGVCGGGRLKRHVY